MNQVATKTASIPAKEVAMASDKGAKIAPENLAEVVRFSEVMSNGGVALPQHLRGNAGACMAVALQALEWEMNPFAVAQKSYVVNGIIAYEAQLIAAVVNTRSGIEGRLKYRYEGNGDDLVCFVTGKIDGEELEYESPRKGDIKPQNSPLWKNDPKQQLGYFSARAWARRHTPEVILGVYDREEAQNFTGPDNARDVTPKVPLTQRLAEANAAQSGEGFDEDHVLNETQPLIDGEAEDVVEEQETGEEAGQTSATADAPEDDGLPSVDASGAEISPEDGFPGDLPSQEEQAQRPVDAFISELDGCQSEKAVYALTDKHAPVINTLGKEELKRANLARAKKLQEITENKSDENQNH